MRTKDRSRNLGEWFSVCLCSLYQSNWKQKLYTIELEFNLTEKRSCVSIGVCVGADTLLFQLLFQLLFKLSSIVVVGFSFCHRFAFDNSHSSLTFDFHAVCANAVCACLFCSDSTTIQCMVTNYSIGLHRIYTI